MRWLWSKANSPFLNVKAMGRFSDCRRWVLDLTILWRAEVSWNRKVTRQTCGHRTLRCPYGVNQAGSRG